MSEVSAVAEKSQPPSRSPDAEKRKQKRRRKKIIKRIIALVIVLAVIGGIVYFMYNLFREEEIVTYPATAIVYRGGIVSSVSGTGVTRAKESASVILPSSGEVKEVFVAEGDWVEKGDPLYNIDSEETREAVETAQKALDNIDKQIQDIYDAQKELDLKAPFAGTLINTTRLNEGDSVLSGTKVATLFDDSIMLITLYFSYAYENDIKAGQAASVSVPSMMSSIEGTVREVHYVRRITPEGSALFQVVIEAANPGTLTEGMSASASLMSPDGETIYPYEAGEFEYNRVYDIIAKISGDVIRADLLDYTRVAEGQTILLLSEDTSASQLETLNRQRDTAAANLKKAQDTLGQFEAVAPMSGTVITCSLTPGQTAEAGKVAVTISDTTTMIVDARIDEMNVSYVKPGMMCSVTQWGRNGQENFFGEIDSVSLEGKYESGVSYFPAVIRVSNMDGRLMPGMYVDYSLVASQSDDCLIVPLGAVKYTEAGTCVFLKAESRPENALDAEELKLEVPEGFYVVPVVIGLSDNSQAEVASGLNEGDEVFTQFTTGAPSSGMGGGMRGGAVSVRIG